MVSVLLLLVFQLTSAYHILPWISSDEEELQILELSPSFVRGTYLHFAPSTGFHFTSGLESLYITTFSGSTLLKAEEPINSYRLFKIMENTFIQKVEYLYESGQVKLIYTDYAVPVKKLYTAVDKEGLDNITADLGMIDIDVHHKQLYLALKKFISCPEVGMIPRAAFLLGHYIGVTGLDYPAALPLYLMALQVTKVSKSNMIDTTNISPLKSFEPHLFNDSGDCLTECPPCQDDECLGLCGYGCNCWKWVCGDCCYHLGCYGHDVCCRKKFVQTKCLFPFSFKCEEPYDQC